MESQAIPLPSSVLFARGVISRLAIWSTLRLAVQESWGGPGGPEKRTWLASVIVDAFEEQNPAPDDQYVEEILVQVMADEFETNLEDESAESVAKDIVRIWEESRVGKQDSVLKFEQLADKLKGKKAEAQQGATSDDDEWEEEDGDGSESSDDEIEADEAPGLLIDRRPKDEPEVDDEGFTMVKGKGKGRN